MSRLKAVTLATMPLFLLGACTMVGPDYKKPATDVTEQWNVNASSIKKQALKDTTWWKAFNDPVMTSLIETAYRNNLSLQSTGVRVLQARAQLAQSVGDLYPQQQGLDGSYTYQTIGNNSSLSDTIPSSFSTDAYTFSSAWEADFWGKYRRAIRSNDAAFLSSVEAYNQALLSLISDVATTYVNIRMYEQLIAVTKSNIVVQKESLRIANARFTSGQVSLLDVEQAKTQLAQTEAKLPPYVIDLVQQKNALAVYLGTTPDKVDALLGKKRPIPTAPKVIAIGLPKDVLRQRPDVRQAELDAITQSELIGAVKAQLYPAFSLTGTFGAQSSDIGESTTSDIFQWSSHTVSIGPSLSLPLLNYGQITNQVRAQDAAFQQAILNFQNTVLVAQKEVQNNIVSFVETQKTVVALEKANVAAEKTMELSLIRYKAGETDYTTVLDAEQDLLSVQTSLADAQGGIPLSAVALYRSLGGGWQLDRGQDVVPDYVKKQMAERTNWGDLLKTPEHAAPKTSQEQTEQTLLPSW